MIFRGFLRPRFVPIFSSLSAAKVFPRQPAYCGDEATDPTTTPKNYYPRPPPPHEIPHFKSQRASVRRDPTASGVVDKKEGFFNSFHVFLRPRLTPIFFLSAGGVFSRRPAYCGGRDSDYYPRSPREVPYSKIEQAWQDPAAVFEREEENKAIVKKSKIYVVIRGKIIV